MPTKLTLKELDVLFEDLSIKYGFSVEQETILRALIDQLKINSIPKAKKLAKIISEEELIDLPVDEIIYAVKGRI
jgi:hypothetical protein